MKNAFSSKIGILLAAAGSAVGLGSIWKFPYVVGENGGGAFIILYIVCSLIFGLPLGRFALQRTTRTSIKVVKLQYSDIICTSSVNNTDGNASLKYGGGGSGAAVPVGSVEATGMKKIKQIV